MERQDDDDVLATMSHELRAPLNAILGWIQLLRAGAVDGAEAERALEIIERNARNEARAVDDALDLARIAAGRMELHADELRLVEALRAALAACESAARARRVRIDVQADPAARVRGDLGRLAQAARALVGSAIRRTVHGGTVEVRLVVDRSTAVLTVREERGPRPSAPRPRGDGAQRRSLVGDERGMSVAVARALARLHGGHLVEEEDGAVMALRLPLTTAVSRSAPDRAVAARP